MSKPITQVQSKHCMLVIKDRYITRDSKRWLIQKAGEVPIQYYYKEKYGWSRSVFNSIHWELQHKVLRSYKLADQRRLLKFAHEWLPTNVRLFREGLEGSPVCRLCGNLEETNDHMLECPLPCQHKIRQKLTDYLWKDVGNQHSNSELNNIIDPALSESPYNKKWTLDMMPISPELIPCIMHQNTIGWHQLYKGRIAKSMIRAVDEHFRSQSSRLQEIYWRTLGQNADS
jgi:hypothetical protein